MKERLEQDIKAALLAGDSATVESLRFIKNAIDTAAKLKGESLTDQETVNLLRKEVKKRQESADLFNKGGNTDMAAKELAEAELIKGYLPEEMSDEEIRRRLSVMVESQDIEKSVASMGRVMGLAKTELGDSADSSAIARVAKEILGA